MSGVLDLVFLGPPGAGKGTQAREVAVRLGVPHLSTGDLLRQAVRAGTPLGAEAQGHMDRGQLVPDSVVDRMVAQWVESPASAKGFLLDGYPRNVAQARVLDALESRLGRAVGAAVLIDVADAVIEERLSGRRACPVCNRMYHVRANPPQREGRCDADGAELVVRSDDRAEVVRERLQVYHRETEPILAHYRKAGIVKGVDGTLAIEDVTAAVVRALEGA